MGIVRLFSSLQEELSFVIYIKYFKNQRFDGGHLGLQDGRHIYHFGNGLIQFHDMTKGGLDTKIMISRRRDIRK